jgi:hypothetical protein
MLDMQATTRLLMTRGTFAIRAFFLSFFSFFTVVFGFVLIALPAVRETLEAFDRQHPAQFGYLAVAQFYWAIAAWYCARLVLERRFLPFEVLLPCEKPRFARGVVRWFPRALGVLATVPMGVVMASAPKESLSLVPRIVPVIVGVIFLVFVVFRRRLFGELVEYTPDPPDLVYGYRRFDRLNRRGWTLLALLAAVPILIFIVLLVDPRLVARAFATPALALFAIGSWNLSTGFLLVYLPLSYRRTVWTAVPLLFAALFSAWVENHNTPSGPPPTLMAARSADTRRTLSEQWAHWTATLDSGPCAKGPIYLVAASGGASRAAFWMAELLTTLEQEMRDRSPDHRACFMRRIFAISGVSGGSLGAATVVSLLADEQVRGASWPSLPGQAAAFLQNDMLAPVAGYLLFPDLVQRFLPFAVYSADRSRGLERTWQADWDDLERTWTGATRATPSNWFGRPLEDLYQDGRADTLPSLFLNTTRVADGRRVLQSNIAFTPDDTYDLLSDGFLTRDLTLAGAVHNSARFLYVSPAGLVWHAPSTPNQKMEPARWGYLVDGGYFENSGAATLVPLIQQIPEQDRWRLSLILISNSASDGRSDYVCDDDSPDQPGPSAISSFLIEATAPPLALYDTRNARAHAADMVAARMLHEYTLVVDNTYELRLPATSQPEPPMTWFVSQKVGEQMISYIKRPQDFGAGTRRLAANLLALRTESPSACFWLKERSTVR